MWKPTWLQSGRNFGFAWLLLAISLTLHIWDEKIHDFIGYYNATVLALYGHLSWFPRIDMGFRTWLAVVVPVNVILFALTPLAFRNVCWLRPVAYVFAALCLSSGLGHMLLTLRGSASPSVVIEGVSPGFYSSPLLCASACYLLWRLRQTTIGKRMHSTLQST